MIVEGMRVADHVVEQRRRDLAQMLSADRYLSVSEICRRLDISEATARRDLTALEEEQVIQRTFGGAMAYLMSRFPTFEQRLLERPKVKMKLARRAHAEIKKGMICYFDGGTTPYTLAKVLQQSPVTPLTAVTASLPAAELLSHIEGVEVHLLGGRLVVTQSVLLGPSTNRNAETWNFDLSFLSAEGMDRDGIWNSQPEVVTLQRQVLARARRNLLMLDRAKIGHRTPHSLCGWIGLFELITDASHEELRAAGIPEHCLPLNPEPPTEK
jgi:DeoR/GlpR family transcriptional regulator of sugar metabolism